VDGSVALFFFRAQISAFHGEVFVYELHDTLLISWQWLLDGVLIHCFDALEKLLVLRDLRAELRYFRGHFHLDLTELWRRHVTAPDAVVRKHAVQFFSGTLHFFYGILKGGRLRVVGDGFYFLQV